MYVWSYAACMTEVAITDARGRLASMSDAARSEAVCLTRRNRPVVAIIDADQRRRLHEDAEELAGIRAVYAARQETERLGATPNRAILPTSPRHRNSCVGRNHN